MSESISIILKLIFESLIILLFYLCSYDLYIMNIYRPPSFSLDENDALKNCIIDFCEDICEDFFCVPSRGL